MKKPQPFSGFGTGEPVSGGYVAFQGIGVVPDLSTEFGINTLPLASRTTLEGGKVPGSEGMLPPPGVGQRLTSNGTPGASSFED